MRKAGGSPRWLALLVGASMVLGMMPTSALADAIVSGEGESSDFVQVEEDGGDEKQADQAETSLDEGGDSAQQSLDEQGSEETTATPQPKAPAESSLHDVYVSDGGNNNNAGTAGAPLATIQAAVSAVSDGGTIHLQSNITLSSYIYIGSKAVTIDGDGHTVTRAENFSAHTDGGRGGYNPAMIEVQNDATLTLVDITLDDANRQPQNGLNPDEPVSYQEQSTTSKENRDKVQGAIIEASGDGHGSIILESGAVLKNFGGMSAVRIGGDVGDGSSLTMKAGSMICDDADTVHGDERTASNDSNTTDGIGPAGAVWNQGGTFTMEAGSSIQYLNGRAIFSEDGGKTYVDGSISNITSNESERNCKWATGDAFAGVAYFGTAPTTEFTLGPNGTISNIMSHDGKGTDVIFMLINGATMTTEAGSEISDSNVSLVDSNAGRIYIGGTVTGISSGNVIVRGRGTNNTFVVEETGQITDCSTTDVGGFYYLNGGKPTIKVAGTISNITAGEVFFISNNGSRANGTINITGTIKDCSGTALLAGDPSIVTISGTISNCGGYALVYGAQANGSSESVVNITDGAVISGNHNGGAQIQVTRKSASLVADNAGRHVSIAPGTLQGSTTIDLAPFDVTIDSGYAPIKLGNASAVTVDAIKSALNDHHPDWAVVNETGGPIWFQPSEDRVHFVASRPQDTKNTGLYAALVELDVDGTPASGANVTFVEVENGSTIDVTLEGLTPGQSYALMFVNSNEYTITPDAVTIYTGGGQGNESYDDGGWPVVTLTDSLDDITKMTYDGQDVLADGTDPLDYLMSQLAVSYTDADGNPVSNDSAAGEYLVHLSWNDGFDPSKLRINGNLVNEKLGLGTIIVRYVQDVDAAKTGESTYAVRTTAPATMESHAVAVVDGNASFTLNGDAGRPVDDARGVSVLDDSLLTNTGDNRQELLEQKAVDSGLLPELGAGQAYRFAFRYLDLVDANNGNAWVANNGDTTIYLPYPDGMTYQDAQGIDFTLVHYKGLHREYGISGQAEVEDAIANAELETIEVTPTEQGLMFTVPSSGFSPFAMVWQTEAHTVTASAGEGGTITPSGPVVVAEGADQTFSIIPDDNHVIADVKIDGQSINLSEVVADDGTGSYTFAAVDADHTIDVSFRAAQHTITATAGEGGSISPSGAVIVTDGADQAFTITANEGYVISDVKVDGVSVGAVNSYAFSDVTSDHAIEVTFAAETVTPPAHEHTWSDWKCDGTSHWRVCEECGAVKDRSEHVFGAWEQVGDGLWERSCTVCGYVQEGTTEPADDEGTDKPTNESTDEELPQSGDSTNATLTGLLAVGGVVVAGSAMALRARRRNG